MIPVIVRWDYGEGEDLLLIDVSGNMGVVVYPGGRLDYHVLSTLRIERPNSQFPLGYIWSRAEAERDAS